MEQKPITAIIVGAGHRSFVYSELAITNPEMLKIVGVADPNPVRRKKAMEHFGFGEDMCFESAQELATKGKLADAVINGTMDEQHLETAIPLLDCGYDMLLEKPFATNESEMRELVHCVKENGNKVMICHVLRYTPFYKSVREVLDSGRIGRLIAIQADERVTPGISSVISRSPWRRYARLSGGTMMEKSSHDMDLMNWFAGGRPVAVNSFGGSLLLRPNPSLPMKCAECAVRFAEGLDGVRR